MKSVEEYAAAYRETDQAAVPNEQVLCVGVLSRPGGMSLLCSPTSVPWRAW